MNQLIINVVAGLVVMIFVLYIIAVLAYRNWNQYDTFRLHMICLFVFYMTKPHKQYRMILFSLFLNESIRLRSVLWPEIPKPELSEEFFKKVSSQCFLLVSDPINQHIFGVYRKFVAAGVQTRVNTESKVTELKRVFASS